jgi:hypothetical protein
MKVITKQAFADAREFIHDRARPLDRALFRFHFESGSAAEVLRELAPYQNDDGGFGHGLEADQHAAASSAVATGIAAAVFREVRAPADHPLVLRAIAYLVKTYDRHRQIWEIVPPAVEDAPHAPWWSYADIETTFDGSRINPMAGIIGALYDYPALVPGVLLDEVTGVLLERLRSRGRRIASDEFKCIVFLAETEHLRPAVREQVRVDAVAAVADSIEFDPTRWEEYRLQPLEVLHSPASFLAPAIDPAAVQTNLDYWVDLQQPDGGWPLTWSWAEIDAEAWVRAEADARGHVTVERLRALRAHGRLDAS